MVPKIIILYGNLSVVNRANRTSRIHLQDNLIDPLPFLRGVAIVNIYVLTRHKWDSYWMVQLTRCLLITARGIEIATAQR